MGGMEILLPAIGSLAGSTLAGPAIAEGLGSVLGMAALTPAAAAAGVTIPMSSIAGMSLGGIGGALGGTAGSTLSQVLAGGDKGSVPDLPKMAGQPAGLGQTMGKQGAFAVPVPPPIQSASIRPIGAAMPQTIGARQAPLEELRRKLGLA